MDLTKSHINYKLSGKFSKKFHWFFICRFDKKKLDGVKKNLLEFDFIKEKF